MQAGLIKNIEKLKNAELLNFNFLKGILIK